MDEEVSKLSFRRRPFKFDKRYQAHYRPELRLHQILSLSLKMIRRMFELYLWNTRRLKHTKLIVNCWIPTSQSAWWILSTKYFRHTWSTINWKCINISVFLITYLDFIGKILTRKISWKQFLRFKVCPSIRRVMKKY